MSDIPDICVHGLGYIGLPTAAVLTDTGYDVHGFDTNSEHRDHLQSGNLDIDEQDLERFIEGALDDGLAIVDEISPADYHLICVPTPYDRRADEFDFSYIETAGEGVAEVLRPGDTVVLEATVPPGTSEGRFRCVLERSGLSAAEEFLLGYSPETILPGNTLTELHQNDRLIGTVAGRSANNIVTLYDSFVAGKIERTDATTAEFVKLIQNAYRDVNIAFANEVAMLAREFDVNTSRAIALANNHPRVDILRPGPGVGGHCLPVDPLFLRTDETSTQLIDAARDVNDGMADLVTELLTVALGDLTDTTITLLGVAYKGGVGDTRMSPSLLLSEALETEGVADVRLTDPYVDESDIERTLAPLQESIKDVDAAVIVTDHPEYGALNPEEFAVQMQGTVVVDTRSMIETERWEEAGLDVYTI